MAFITQFATSDQISLNGSKRHLSVAHKSNSLGARCLKSSKFFEMKVLRPLPGNEKQARFTHVGNMYLHYIGSQLVRQLEVPLDASKPPKWQIRKTAQDVSLMYNISLDVVARFRTMQMTFSQFDAIWQKYVESEQEIQQPQASMRASEHSITFSSGSIPSDSPQNNRVSLENWSSHSSVNTSSPSSVYSRSSQSEGYTEVYLNAVGMREKENGHAIDIPRRPPQSGKAPTPLTFANDFHTERISTVEIGAGHMVPPSLPAHTITQQV